MIGNPLDTQTQTVSDLDRTISVAELETAVGQIADKIISDVSLAGTPLDSSESKIVRDKVKYTVGAVYKGGYPDLADNSTEGHLKNIHDIVDPKLGSATSEGLADLDAMVKARKDAAEDLRQRARKYMGNP